MRLEVLKQFAFAPDGQAVRMTTVGEIIDVPGDLVPGLLTERLVGEPRPQRETKVAEPEPEIDDADQEDEPAPQPKRRGRPRRENKDAAAPRRTSN